MSIAYWRKCDFQVHSPRDPNWDGVRPIGMNDQASDETSPITKEAVEKQRSEWAEKLIGKCKTIGLEAIALTDHHEMVMVPYVQEAIQARKQTDESFNLWLFPGMELTTRGGKQCLIIFDADLSEEWRETAAKRLGIAASENSKLQSKFETVKPLELSYPDIAEQLDEFLELRGRYIVLPNVSQGNDHTVLKKAAHADFLEMNYVGGYLDRGQTIHSLSSTNRNRLSGDDEKWSKREIYPMPTSDSRSEDFAYLGSNDCWIKLAEPTAEAIRQAFLSNRSRIRIDPPRLPSLYIKRVMVDGSITLKTASLDISPELNSIIGGRGTGKSTFIEYLTFGLGCSCFDSPTPRYSGGERLSELLEDTLVSQLGSVELEIVQDNATFQVVREHTTDYQPQLTYPNGLEEQVDISELQKLFPAVVYSQGELGEIGKQAQERKDLTDLLQFVDQGYKRVQERLLDSMQTSEKSVGAAMERLVSEWGLKSKLDQLVLRMKSETQRLEALQETLPKLSSKDEKTTEYYNAAFRFESNRLAASQHADRILRELDAVTSGLSGEHDLTTAAALGSDATDVRDRYRDLYATFETSLEATQIALKAKRAALTDAESKWSERFLLARTEHKEVLDKLGQHQDVTAQIVKLQDSIAEASAESSEVQSKLIELGDMPQVFSSTRTIHKENVQDFRRKTEEWAARIESLSNGRIRAKVTADGDISGVIDALRAFSAGTGSQELMREKRLKELLSGQSADSLVDELTSECLALLEWHFRENSNAPTRPECSLLEDILGTTRRIQEGISSHLDPSRVVAIATASAMPSIELFYIDQERELSFEKASEGQRAAALLFMLLEQERGPLIIDQPEGDLDNKIITTLTTSLHQAKAKRQLIFASHNANIVVNGSSELVAHLELTEDGEREFVHTGAIDKDDVRSVITSTMEGGERAFKDRMDKYGY